MILVICAVFSTNYAKVINIPGQPPYTSIGKFASGGNTHVTGYSLENFQGEKYEFSPGTKTFIQNPGQRITFPCRSFKVPNGFSIKLVTYIQYGTSKYQMSSATSTMNQCGMGWTEYSTSIFIIEVTVTGTSTGPLMKLISPFYDQLLTIQALYITQGIYSQKIKGCGRDISLIKADIATYSSKITTLQSQLSIYEAEVKSNEEKIEIWEARMKGVTRQSRQSQSITQIKEQITKIQTEISTLEKKRADLMNQLKQKNTLINTLNTEISTLDSEITKLNSELTTKKEKQRIAAVNAGEAHSNATKNKEDADNCQSTIDGLKKQIENINKKITAETTKMNNFKKEFDKYTKEYNKYHQEESSYEADIKTLNQSKTTKSNTLVQKKSKLETEEDNKDTLVTSVNSTSESLSKKETSLQVTRQSLSVAQEEQVKEDKAKIQGKIDELTKSNIKINIQITTVSKEITIASNKLTQYTTEKTTVTSCINNNTKSLDQAKSSFNIEFNKGFAQLKEILTTSKGIGAPIIMGVWETFDKNLPIQVYDIKVVQNLNIYIKVVPNNISSGKLLMAKVKRRRFVRRYHRMK